MVESGPFKPPINLDGAHSFSLDGSLSVSSWKESALDILLMTVYLITSAFCIRQLFVCWSRRHYNKLDVSAQETEPLFSDEIDV